MFTQPRTPILIIAGTAEARRLATRLRGKCSVMLPGQARVAAKWSVPVSPFELSEETLAQRLFYHVKVLVDASHPFDLQASEIAVKAAQDAEIPLVRLERRPWRPQRADRWVNFRREEDVARHLYRGERLFLATGRETLRRFTNLHHNYVFCRQLSEHQEPFPLPNGRFLYGDAPFTVPAEMALLRRLRIDWLVLRNAGGRGAWPKIEAARKLGINVGMLQRPPMPKACVVRSVSGAVNWLHPWL